MFECIGIKSHIRQELSLSQVGTVGKYPIAQRRDRCGYLHGSNCTTLKGTLAYARHFSCAAEADCCQISAATECITGDDTYCSRNKDFQQSAIIERAFPYARNACKVYFCKFAAITKSIHSDTRHIFRQSNRSQRITATETTIAKASQALRQSNRSQRSTATETIRDKASQALRQSNRSQGSTATETIIAKTSQALRQSNRSQRSTATETIIAKTSQALRQSNRSQRSTTTETIRANTSQALRQSNRSQRSTATETIRAKASYCLRNYNGAKVCTTREHFITYRSNPVFKLYSDEIGDVWKEIFQTLLVHRHGNISESNATSIRIFTDISNTFSRDINGSQTRATIKGFSSNFLNTIRNSEGRESCTSLECGSDYCGTIRHCTCCDW